MVLSQTAIEIINIQNTQEIKASVMLLLFIYAILILIFKHKLNINESYLNYWLYYLGSVTSWITILFSPLLLVLLYNYNIGYELFLLMVSAIYLFFIAIFIGLSLWKGGTAILNIYGVNDWGEFKDQRKAQKSMNKYG